MGNTVAGSADGGEQARFNSPNDVAVDGCGNLYVADSFNNTVRKITPAGIVTTFAGSAGVAGSNDGTGSAARFWGLRGIAVDAAGNLYVADTFNFTLRKITPAGVVSTLAGLAGSRGHLDGTGSGARFSETQGVTVDSADNVYVADDDGTIRKITPGGVVSTLAGPGGFTGPQDMAVDNAGNIYVADAFGHNISKITPSGIVSNLAGMHGVNGSVDGTGSAARFYECGGVTVDGDGNVYVGDTFNQTVRKITPAGVVTTLAGVAGVAGETDGLASVARFFSPKGMATDSAGDLYIADLQNCAIRKITPAGDVRTLAGYEAGSNDGNGIPAQFNSPQGVAVDNAGGNVYVADSNNHTVRQITPAGLVSTFAGTAGTSGSADGMGSAAGFNSPIGVAVDSVGSVYVADTFNHTIRRITPSGHVITFAGSPGSSGSVDGAGSSARFNLPTGVAVDSQGSVYVADTGNHIIRKITPARVVSTLAGSTGDIGSVDGTGGVARFNSPSGVTVDSAGNIYVADTGNNTFRRITPAGVVSTLAGTAGSTGFADGMGGAARFNAPQGVTVDNAGNLYVGDTSNNMVRKITPSGVVSTLSASLSRPRGVSMRNDGHLYVANTNDHTILVGTDTSALDAFIVSPLVAIGAVGQPFVYQFKTIGATSLAVTNLPPGLVFDTALSAIIGKTTADGTFQVGLIASSSQSSANATLMVTAQTAPATGPIITSSNAATARVGQPFQFQVTTTGATSSATLSASGLPPGLSADPVTGLIWGTSTNEGVFSATLTVTDSSFSTTSTLQVATTTDPALPVIISSNTALLTPGQPFSYTITAPGSLDPFDPTSYALVFNLPSGLFFDANTGTISGTYSGFALHSPNRPDVSGGIIANVQLFATNSHGTATLPLTFFSAPTGAVNISTRVAAGTDDKVLIGGFIVIGNVPKKLVIRAIGPSLRVNGVAIPGAMQDPTLELHDSVGLSSSNDNWRDTQENEIIGTGIAPTDEHESTILAYLNPGNYTAIVRGKDNSSGIAVVEVYDLGTASLDASSTSKLAQISTRGLVLTGDNVMIGGFIVRTDAAKVIVRAIGPSLNGIVPGALQDTILELHDGSGATIASNDDWRTDQEQPIIDTTVPPTDNRESAIVATLNPGAYTAIVRGKDNTMGVALVEVYVLQ
jgi:sugar lactone lactonase YvrE